ncbi:MAG: DUF167 domain-containing protein [Thermoleophilia bacterium]|nr:DUF167 domain-containing protein [Thermoleophilia bacterium]
MAEPSARLRLRVVPGASEDALVGRHGDAWKVRVAAPPERGAANRAVVELLARTLVVSPASVAVVSGHGARDKTIGVRGLAAAEAERRLRAAERKDRRP